MATQKHQQKRNETGRDRRSESEGRSLPEKVTLVASIAVVLALIGYIGWHGLFVERGVPMVDARMLLDKARQRGDRWAIPLEIKNASDVPLEDVNVKVEITTPEGERTDMTISFPYLAERETDNAFVVSELEPKKADPKPTVESFKQQKDSQGY